jgi:hypothetical protein
MTDREVMQMALNALELLSGAKTVEGVFIYADQEIKALRTALAQPEPEPVAWMVRENFADLGLWEERIIFTIVDEGRGTPLYTAPPQRKPLSDEEIDAATQAWAGHSLVSLDRLIMCREYARAIETAHGIKEKNT